MAGIGDYKKGTSFSEMFKKKSPFSFLNFNIGGTQVSKGGDRTTTKYKRKDKTKITGDKDIF